jgi:hypothetical protein
MGEKPGKAPNLGEASSTTCSRWRWLEVFVEPPKCKFDRKGLPEPLGDYTTLAHQWENH